MSLQFDEVFCLACICNCSFLLYCLEFVFKLIKINSDITTQKIYFHESSEGQYLKDNQSCLFNTTLYWKNSLTNHGCF